MEKEANQYDGQMGNGYQPLPTANASSAQPPSADVIPTYEQLYEVYKHARGMCFGVDWNKGTHARAHRKRLEAAVNNIKPCHLPTT